MSIETVYIQGTKKEANLKLVTSKPVSGLKFGLSGPRVVYLDDMPGGTVIKFYEKMIQGNPYAVAYGQWDKAKRIIK
jgi:hypothetical protein